MPVDQVQYSDKYYDDTYEYRHVILTNTELAAQIPKTHLMSETEWRNLGVQQSPGWVHYMMHTPGVFVQTFLLLQLSQLLLKRLEA
ncbi:cyclin-dependent kinases regulatory subunit isoform X2 [Frankliniella occidentalis]|uniref:Cyclin-dependent kinases regulatory subunit n=1 Tax=Frankliniella occidentalis TaxID=133901 RepID=A0A9C6X074_FRAOC|nr:cyclin-dependent kinases regulatory subunit isoform X2 [Frankliniella occidentalis]